jgi:hypothetical protein
MSFKRLDSQDVTISAESVVAPIWSTNQYEHTAFFTSSAQVASNTGNYYLEVYHENPATTPESAEVQFSVTYGHLQGSGSTPFNNSIPQNTPTSVIYGQYRTLIYGDENQNFQFKTEDEIESIYAITIDRARYKEKLLPGSLNLTLTVGSTTLNLTDNSKETPTSVFVDAGRVFQIISGSNGASALGSNQGLASNEQSYGLLLPDIGVILLNGTALDLDLGLNTGSGTTANNPQKLFNAISDGASFRLRSEETVTSNYVFIRARNSEFNYTTNPSNITNTGELVHDVMIANPQSYVTTVGLYNESNDLVAVAKLSRPLLKDFTKEALIRIKLDY